MPEWFNEGLRFRCTRCSNCCRHESGYVFLSKEDIRRLAAGLDLSEEEFLEKYTRVVEPAGARRISLKEQKNFDCIFWQDGHCSVYPWRPVQCRTYPFWDALVGSQEDWEREKKSCPGIGEGRLHTAEEIRNRLTARRKSPPVDAEDVQLPASHGRPQT